MSRIVVYRGGHPGGRLPLRERIGLALVGAATLAAFVAVMLASLVLVIPLVLVALVVVGRFAWRVRREMRRAGVAPDGNEATWRDGPRWPGEPWR